MKHGYLAMALGLVATVSACSSKPATPELKPLDQKLVADGREIFRNETFGNESFWTDVMRMHEVITKSVSPEAALAAGLKVDSDALPAEVKEAIVAGKVDLKDPATTITLLKLNAVVGLRGTVETVGGHDRLVRVGITCALCHSGVDDSFAPGIGKRQDGWAATDLNIGAIVAMSPTISKEIKATMLSWGPGRYDPRINQDGKNTPVMIPPAYGLNGVAKGTYTGDGSVAYWNSYVAVTQMHGHGDFKEPRLGIAIDDHPDLVTSKLPALAAYQFSLLAPPAPGAFNASAVKRGEAVFRGKAKCASCHIPEQQFTDVGKGTLHEASATGMNPEYAARSATKQYRTTPLRGLWQHGPYFHDGSAATLVAVVGHYDRTLSLSLSTQQKADLVAYVERL